MKPKFTFLLYLFLLAIFFNSLKSYAKSSAITSNIYKQLSALKCDSLIKANANNPNFVILDVRTPNEYNVSHILNAINRNSGATDIDAQLAALPKQKLYLLHCQSGGRSATVFSKMKSLNFAEVYEMINGFNSWTAASLPITTVVQPKLMLVSHVENLKGTISDTIKITVTNCANGKLTFSKVTVTDNHGANHNFNMAQTLDGPFDYTFSVIHNPKYYGNDSTKVRIESNGGNIEFHVIIKNGIVVRNNSVDLVENVVFPNPADKRLFVNIGAKYIFEEISIINIAGKAVSQKFDFYGSQGVDVSDLPNGIYIVRIKSDNKVYSKKFMIRH